MDNKTVELDIPATAAERTARIKECGFCQQGYHDRCLYPMSCACSHCHPQPDGVIVPGEGSSSTEYEKWLATQPHIAARLADGSFSQSAGYAIWRGAWLTLRAAYEAREILAREVQRRMDAVVDAAVEWRFSDLPIDGESGGAFEMGDKLEAAIDSLLELRDKRA